MLEKVPKMWKKRKKKSQISKKRQKCLKNREKPPNISKKQQKF